MLRFLSYDIVFQEIPDEITLAVNISNCPNRCKGCHSPHLMEDRGEMLDAGVIADLLERYGNAITCFCFMGGDASPLEIECLAAFVRKNYGVKIAWYSGKSRMPDGCSIRYFDYVKLGPYIQRLGGLNSVTTNQRFYRIEHEKMIDMTDCFFQIGNPVRQYEFNG
ncbi:MAG: anaerobic ribonucleoside-triphosphate reductase activating protein [Prevotellaceae bacterium]|jgi:anaerobic ribonucleoside-triphosphate reductase activating protein|nr:anaerobic ribonucleoside-triphosphate reductase activating protein [Prevotellaceae bacterium]